MYRRRYAGAIRQMAYFGSIVSENEHNYQVGKLAIITF
jgi:hypothetical protein